MKVSEYIRQAWASVKEQPPKQRWEYFWEYYKFPAIAVVLVIVLAIQGVISLVNTKDTVLTGVTLNCKLGVKAEDFWDGFYEYAGIDSKESEAAVYTDINLLTGQSKNNADAIQRIMAGIAIHDMDFIVGKDEAFRMCAYSTGGMLADLRDFLDEATLAKLSDRIYYIDGAVLEEINKPVGEQVEPELLTYPDPHKPEAMKDPIPVGINISGCEAFVKGYYLSGATVYWGIVPNTIRADLVLQMLTYLLAQ